MELLALALAVLPSSTQLGPSSIFLADPDADPISHMRLLGASVACGRYGLPGAGNVGGYALIAGAPGDDLLGEEAGGAYWYDSGVLHSPNLNLGAVAAGDQVGQVSIDGNLLVVGSWRAGSMETGVVRVFTYDVPTNAWNLEATQFTATDFMAQAGDRFSALAVQDDSQDIFVVGSRLADSGTAIDQGAAFVVERTGTSWSGNVITQLIPSLPMPQPLSAGDNFGSVAIHGNRVVVGARRFDSGSSACPQGAASCQQGAVFVFERQSVGSWANTAFLKARWAVDSTGMSTSANDIPTPSLFDDNYINDEFGFSVALADDWLVVGAPGRDLECTDFSMEANCESGAAYVYQRSGTNWEIFQRLSPQDDFQPANPIQSSSPVPGIFQRFGYSVAIDGNRIVVGAPGTLTAQPNGSSLNTGAVFVYELGVDDAPVSWLPTRSITEGDLALAPPPAPGGTPSDPGSLGPFFGSSIDLDSSLIAVGAPRAWSNGRQFAGRAYVYHLLPEENDLLYPTLCNGVAGCMNCPCGNDAAPGTLGGCMNSVGTSARLSACGSASVTADTLRLELIGAGPGALCILNAGQNLLPLMGVCPPGSGISAVGTFDGLRCIGGGMTGTIRLGNRSASVLGDVGVTNRGWGFPDAPAAGVLTTLAMPAMPVSGATWYFQVTYRDVMWPAQSPVCTTELNTSNAVSATSIP